VPLGASVPAGPVHDGIAERLAQGIISYDIPGFVGKSIDV